jgi:transcriptional antiterminator Rof (Rho-off)
VNLATSKLVKCLELAQMELALIFHYLLKLTFSGVKQHRQKPEEEENQYECTNILFPNC